MTDSATQPSSFDQAWRGDAPAASTDEDVPGRLDAQIDADTDEALDDQDNLDGEAEETLEDVEHEGRRYKVPKALKDAFLRHADYTRKTQELAEHRRAFEAHAAEIVHAQQRHIEDHARLVALDDQLEAFDRLDWNSLEAQDPARAQQLWRQFTQLKEGRAELIGRVQWMEEQRAIEAQRHAATRVEQGHHELARDIKDWSPELANKLHAFGQQAFGFTPEEIGSVDDPRMIKVLHLAFVGDQALKKRAAAERLSANQSARPVSQVGAHAPAGRNPDRMSTAEWMSFERERLRKKAGR